MTKSDEHIGLAIDTLENLIHAMNIPIPAQTHLDMLKHSLPEVLEQLKDGYVLAFGENPWE